MIKIINTCCRYLVAIVFIFSGFVKLLDPYGTAYKISDYLELINWQLPFALYLIVSVLLAMVEFLIGINLFFKAFYKKTLKALLFIVPVFSVLTLYIAIADPVQDCGCFGDALIIDNWSTFIKNIVLLALSIELWRNRNYMRSRVVEQAQMAIVGVTVLFAMLLAINAIRHLPFVDFRPYHVGASIPEGMRVPQDEPQDVYQTIYYYEKDGVTEEFTENNYPWQDTTWHYVNSESVLIEKGADPAIHDFVLNHFEYGDITNEVLQDPNYNFCLVAPQLDQVSKRSLSKIASLAAYCTDNSYRFLVLTASVGASVDAFKAQFDHTLEFCNVDEIQLKTMVRAKPGLMLLRDGIIMAKFHHNDMPDFGESPNPMTTVLSQKEKQKSRRIVLLLALLLGFVYYKLMQFKDYSK